MVLSHIEVLSWVQACRLAEFCAEPPINIVSLSLALVLVGEKSLIDSLGWTSLHTGVELRGVCCLADLIRVFLTY